VRLPGPPYYSSRTCWDSQPADLGRANYGAHLDRYQVSKQGEQLAQDDPYIIRNGRHREVVLHTAEHVREFMRNDSKGQSLSSALSWTYGLTRCRPFQAARLKFRRLFLPVG
jgi:hypothetical protein